ncbi:NADH-quinone oxidoreductase subunit N [Methylobacter sp. YRD-M1]|uniref:NADH-quinone oxidoreductase subunit N n=1 Tax=Methylobacter sp. YRD-M1 TaxID=2911520 RepID=UPI00227CE07C|nr:NADH-quinone oxidoreductase subunit N [Methylobacter sp. YRD-M1]WAK00256.1 NADH-quinone oxidoreductase subunit N [Methylobacter sp. YRD-M1]
MNSSQLIAFLPVICIAASAVIVMLTIAIRRHFALTCLVAGLGVLVSLLALMAAGRQSPVYVTSLVRVDAYGLFAMALLLLAGLVVIVFCYDYFKDREGEKEELLFLVLTALLGGCVLVTASHFATFFIGLETLSVSLFVMVGYELGQSRPLEAATKYLVLSGVSSALLLMGMALIYSECGQLSFSGIEQYLAEQEIFNAMVLTGIVFIVAGVGFKLSLAPFHMWTPDVYEGAPAPVTAFIATVSKGAVFLLLLRFFLSAGYSYASVMTVITVMAVMSILFGNVLALLQDNVKRMLAYSSIAHMGYLLIAFIAGGGIESDFVVEAVIFYLVAYFMTTLGAFGVVSLLSTPQAEAVELSSYRGLFWRRPGLATVFTLMLLSLAGIPLTAGFIGKFYIFAVGADAQLWGMLLMLIIGSGLGLYYYLRVIVVMSISQESGNYPGREAALGRMSLAALVLLTLLLVWLGVDPIHLMSLIHGV